MPVTQIATQERAFVRLHEVYKQGAANMARETLPSRWRKEVRNIQVPRAELERVWQSQDETDVQLQKQIDEIKANAAATYTPRDAMLDMRERLLERQRPSSSHDGGVLGRNLFKKTSPTSLPGSSFTCRNMGN